MNIIEISSENRNETDIFTLVSERDLYHYYEPDHGIFIAESPKVIERALNAGEEELAELYRRYGIQEEENNEEKEA